MRHAAIPSSCGMFVYRLLTSIVSNIVCAGSGVDSMKFINCLLSLMYEGVSFIAGCSSVSMKLDMRICVLWVHYILKLLILIS